MIIELSDQQAKRVKEGRSIEFTDASTQQPFVLMAREQYERVRHLLEPELNDGKDDASSEIPPGILRSQQAFWRDLPELLQSPENHGQYVCYHGDQRIGIGSYSSLIHECNHRGINGDAFYIDRIESHEMPPWEIEDVEPLGSHHLE